MGEPRNDAAPPAPKMAASTSSTGPDWGAAMGEDLKRLGFAEGRLVLRGGKEESSEELGLVWGGERSGAEGITIVVECKGSEVFAEGRSVGVVALRVHAASGPVQVGSLADTTELVCLGRAKVLALTTCPLTGKDIACVVAIDPLPETSDP